MQAPLLDTSQPEKKFSPKLKSGNDVCRSYSVNLPFSVVYLVQEQPFTLIDLAKSYRTLSEMFARNAIRYQRVNEKWERKRKRKKERRSRGTTESGRDEFLWMEASLPPAPHTNTLWQKVGGVQMRRFNKSLFLLYTKQLIPVLWPVRSVGALLLFQLFAQRVYALSNNK